MSPTPQPGGERSRMLRFLRSPDLWPHWPFLPLIRRREGREEGLGVLFDAWGACGLTGYSRTVFLTNVLLLPQRLDAFLALPRETFDTADEVADAEWRVD